MRQISVPISKINKKTREVHGILANEIRDKEGEIMDYTDSKPLFEKWSAGIKKASGGKSVGNLREMHQPIVAGKFTSINFNDDLKQIEVISKVSNDSSWKKVLDGELNGFSIYGNPTYRRRDKVNKAIRYAVEPVEGSLVDNPCMYGADFTLIKEDGAEIITKFAGEKKPYQFWHCLHDCDLLHKSETEASSCVGVVATSDLDTAEPISKSMYDVSSLASNISSLKWISVDDKNKDKFNSAIKSLFDCLKGMVSVEKDLFQESLDNLASAANAVKTVGTKIIEGDSMKLKVKKSVVANKENDDDDLEFEFDEVEFEKKISKNVGKTVAKAVGAIIKESLDDAFEAVKEDIDTLSKAVQKMAGLPKKSKTVIKSSDRKKKNDDDDDDDEEDKEEKVSKVAKKTSDVNDPELLKVMKAAMRRPINLAAADDDDENEDTETESDDEDSE